MRKYFLLFYFLSIGICAMAQADLDCYFPAYKKGEAALKRNDFDAAIKYFSHAKECLDKPERNDVDKRIEECRRKKRQHQQSQQPVQKPKPTDSTVEPPQSKKPTDSAVETPQAKKPKIHAINPALRFGCIHKRQGMEVTVDFKAENLKDKTIYAECYIVPKDGDNSVSEKYRGTEFDVNGKPGQRGRSIFVENGFEQFTDIFFVPYGAMTLQNYGEQLFDLFVNIYEENNPDTPIEGGTLNGTISSEPVSLFVDNDIVDKSLSFDYAEDNASFNIEVCGNVEWLGVPSWIHATQASLFIDENETTSPREAYLTIRPFDGGNEVHVRVSQKGAPHEKESAPMIAAVINEVRLEHNVVWNDGRRKTFFNVDFDVYGQKGNEVQVYALYYNADGKTIVLDADGNWITGSASVVPKHENSNCEVRFMVDNIRLLKAQNLQENKVKIFITISFDGGKSWVAQSDPKIVSW